MATHGPAPAQGAEGLSGGSGKRKESSGERTQELGHSRVGLFLENVGFP